MTKEEKREKDRQYYLKHSEEIKKRVREYAKENIEKTREWSRKRQMKRRRTIIGRAYHLLQAYNKADENAGRPKGDLTPEWIVENIFSKPCAHCGKEGWKVIGCNRLDNSKPHTKDNVEPCCWECNQKLSVEYNVERQSTPVYQYSLDGELVKVWKSMQEAGRGEFQASCICHCCNGGFFDKKKDKWINTKQHKGYRWSFEPL